MFKYRYVDNLYTMKAIILAAGQGTRLKDLTKQTPKCLMKIGKRTILEHQIKTLEDYGIRDISLVIGTKGDVWNQKAYDFINELCKKENIKMVLNFDNDKSQNSYSLFLAMKEIEKTSILAIDGDLFFNKDVLELACKSLHSVAIISKRVDDLSESGTRVIVDNSGEVVDIGKNVIPSTPSWHIHGGFIKISAEYFNQFKEILSKEKYKPLGLDHTLKEFSEKYELYGLEMNHGWMNINTPQDLKEAEQMWVGLK